MSKVNTKARTSQCPECGAERFWHEDELICAGCDRWWPNEEAMLGIIANRIADLTGVDSETAARLARTGPDEQDEHSISTSAYERLAEISSASTGGHGFGPITEEMRESPEVVRDYASLQNEIRDSAENIELHEIIADASALAARAQAFIGTWADEDNLPDLFCYQEIGNALGMGCNSPEEIRNSLQAIVWVASNAAALVAGGTIARPSAR